MSIWGPNHETIEKTTEETKSIKPMAAQTFKSYQHQDGGRFVFLPKECRLYVDGHGGWHEKIWLPEGETHKLITIVHEAIQDTIILKDWTDMDQHLTLKKGDVATFLFTWRKWSLISHFNNQI